MCVYVCLCVGICWLRGKEVCVLLGECKAANLCEANGIRTCMCSDVCVYVYVCVCVHVCL